MRRALYEGLVPSLGHTSGPVQVTKPASRGPLRLPRHGGRFGVLDAMAAACLMAATSCSSSEPPPPNVVCGPSILTPGAICSCSTQPSSVQGDAGCSPSDVGGDGAVCCSSTGDAGEWYCTCRAGVHCVAQDAGCRCSEDAVLPSDVETASCQPSTGGHCCLFGSIPPTADWQLVGCACGSQACAALGGSEVASCDRAELAFSCVSSQTQVDRCK